MFRFKSVLVVSFCKINASWFFMVFPNAVKSIHLYVSLKSADIFYNKT